VAREIAHHRDRLRKVLHRDADHRRIENRIAERNGGRRIEVVDDEGFKTRILGKLGCVHPKPGDRAIGAFRREMADPTAHEIQDDAAWRQVRAVQFGDRRDRQIVDVCDKTGSIVEAGIRARIYAAEGDIGQHQSFDVRNRYRDAQVFPGRSQI